MRLVTLAFEAMTEADQRKLARTAALDLIKGDQGTNVYYAVVVINTQLYVLQQFTKDKAALTKAIERATGGLSGPGLASESDAILAELKRNLGGAERRRRSTGTCSPRPARPRASRSTTGPRRCRPSWLRVMLDMLRMDAGGRGAGHASHALRAAGAGGGPAVDSRPQVGDLLHRGHVSHAGIGRAVSQSDEHREPRQRHVLFGGYARRDDDRRRTRARGAS